MATVTWISVLQQENVRCVTVNIMSDNCGGLWYWEIYNYSPYLSVFLAALRHIKCYSPRLNEVYKRIVHRGCDRFERDL